MMFDNTNPYTIHIEKVDGIDHYYISFLDGNGVFNETEVSRSIYVEFCQFVKQARNLRRSDERHIEQSNLSDELLNKRALNPTRSIEEIFFSRARSEQLMLMITELPEIQRRRFILYYEFDLTYEQIAEIEDCSKMAVKYSVDIAREKILKKFKE